MEFSSPVYTPPKNSRLSLSRLKKLRRESQQGKENNINESVQSTIDDNDKNKHNFIRTALHMDSPTDINSQRQEEDKNEDEESNDKIQFHVEINGDALLSSSSSSSSSSDHDSLDSPIQNSSYQDYEDLEFTACHPSDDENDVNDNARLDEEDRKPAYEKERTHEEDTDEDELLLKPSPWVKSRVSKHQSVFLLEDDSDNDSVEINSPSMEESKAGTTTVHCGLRSPPPYPRNILSKPKSSPSKSPLLKDCIESSSDEELELNIIKVAKKIIPPSSGKRQSKGSNDREVICLDDDDSEDDTTLILANEAIAKRSERQSLMPQHWGSSGMKKRRSESSSFAAALTRRPISLSDINYSRNDLNGGSGLGLGGVQVFKGGAQYAENSDEDDEKEPAKKSRRTKSKRNKGTKTKSKRKRSKSSVKRKRTGGTTAARRSNAFRANRSSDWDTAQQGVRPYNGGDSNTNGSYGWSRGRQRGTRLGEVNLDPRLGNLGGATIQF